MFLVPSTSKELPEPQVEPAKKKPCLEPCFMVSKEFYFNHVAESC